MMIYWIHIYNIPEKWGVKVSQDKPLKSPTDILHVRISVFLHIQWKNNWFYLVYDQLRLQQCFLQLTYSIGLFLSFDTGLMI